MNIVFPDIDTHTINDLFKVIFQNYGTNIMSISIFIDIGSDMEDNDECGLSHFLEHMMFKGNINGTETSIIDKLSFYGLSFNASTSRKCIKFSISGNIAYYDLIINTLLQMIFEPQFPLKDIENEIGVVLSELSEQNDSHMYHYSQFISNLMFEHIDPLINKSILGTVDDIKSFNRDKLLNYYTNKFLHAMKTLVIKCPIDIKPKIVNIIENRFQTLTSWEPIYNPVVSELVITSYRKHIPNISHFILPYSQCNVNIYFRSINEYSEYNLIANILSCIIGTGICSRLFQLLRDELGITYSQNSNNYSREKYGYFHVSFQTDPCNVKLAIEKTTEMLLDFQDITEKELQKIKNKYETGILCESEDLTNVGSIIVDYILNEINPQEYITIRSKIQNICCNDINKFAKHIFIRDNMSIFVGSNNKDIEFI